MKINNKVLVLLACLISLSSFMIYFFLFMSFGKFSYCTLLSLQFVPFREFVGGRYGNNIQVSQAHLAKEVLAEVPDQVLAYMKKKGVRAQQHGAAQARGGEGVAGARASAPPQNTQW